MVKTTEPQTKLVKPKTKAGKRVLEKRAPKLVEDPRRSLLLHGNRTSQIIKDVLVDLHKMKGADSVKFSRSNPDVRPFEAGGEAALELQCSRNNCSLFALGSHQKKRPHNLVLGRLYDFRLYDAVEFGVRQYRSVQSFGSGAAQAQLGNKPCFVFVGDVFEADPTMRQVKSLLLDFFRGRQVESINLKGLDRVIFVTQHPESKLVLFRQYSVRYKRSGTRVPRMELSEMGPTLDLEVRRSQQPPVDLEKEATKQPKLDKKKEKNVGSDVLDGKVGHIYMPKQDVDSIALAKPKGVKRERRQAAADAATAKKQRTAAAADGGGGGGGGGSE